MKLFAFATVAMIAGVLLAGQLGAPLVMVASAGASLGALLFSALRKHLALGAIAGLILSLIAFAIISPRFDFKIRCEFGDPSDLPPKRHPAGYVYVIQDVDISKLYKIGRTNNPKGRLNKFAVELPFETEIVAIVATEDAPALEWQLHQRYADSRKRGEWFNLNRDQVHEICSI